MQQGDPAALYEEIASATGMPFPNLVYRVLGEEPGRLLDCWSRVRDGLRAVGRDTLRARVLQPAIDAARPLEGIGSVSASQCDLLESVFDAYDAGNSCNAVVVQLLLNGSPGDPGSDLVPSREAAGRGSVGRTLPPMLELQEMGVDARDLVLRLAAVLDPAGDVVPSAFRHLAHDPDLLGAVSATIVRADREGLLQAVGGEVQAAVGTAVRAWPAMVEPVSDPSTRAALAPFARAIPRMLAVSALLRAAHCSAPGAGAAGSARNGPQ